MSSSSSFSPPSDKENTTSPDGRNPLSLNAFSPEPDISVHPMSPTDRMLSPCTKQLMGKGKKTAHAPRAGGGHLSKKMWGPPRKQVQYQLATMVQPRPSPCPSNFDFILGSSSENRKEVMDTVRWSYRQLSPDIDGRRRFKCVIRLPNYLCSLT